MGAGIEYDAIPFVVTSIVNSVPILIVTINYRLALLDFLADQQLYEERSGMRNKSPLVDKVLEVSVSAFFSHHL